MSHMKNGVPYMHMGEFDMFVGFTSSPNNYLKEMRRLGVDDPPAFVNPNTAASCKTFERGTDTICIVTLCRKAAAKHKACPAQIASMLAHEAVHVKQKLMEAISERDPSAEFEAYIV